MRASSGAGTAWLAVVAVAACIGSSGCGGRESLEPVDLSDPGTGTTTDATAPVSPATQSALMTRWNATVDAVGLTIDFHWRSYDQFPHPTFNGGGTPQAYQDFATILLAFFQRQDDFQYLASNHLFTTPLRYVYASGQVGLDTTFQQLTTDFSAPGGFGNIPAATRQGLQGYLAQMQ